MTSRNIFPKRLKLITRSVYGVVCVMEHFEQNASEVEHTRGVLKFMKKIISRPSKDTKRNITMSVKSVYSLRFL